MSRSHVFSEQPLTIDTLCELAGGAVTATFDTASQERIERGRAIVEDCLASGEPIYGATTGIGSQKDVAVTPRELASFSDRMIVSEATLAPGPAYDECISRGALILLCHNFARGQCGVTPVLPAALLELLASPTLPSVRRDCSFGVADLTPLSQLALPLIGRALNGAAITGPSLRLAPKESVSLLDNNAFGLAEAAYVLRDARRLLQAFDVAAAAACEGFRAGLAPHTTAAAGGWRGRGARLARTHLNALLTGSDLLHAGAARFLQDPLSFRGITQIHGAAYEALQWATEHVEAEINSAADNPLVDLDTGVLLTSASMISVMPPLAIDCLRQALAKVALTSHERSLKLQMPAFSGLPVGLSQEGAADGGILAINLHYIASSRLGILQAAALPVTGLYIGHTADSVEDVSTQLPLAVTQTRTVIERAWELAIIEMIVAVWAIARRRIVPTSLGRGPRIIYERLLPELHIGAEGQRIFDLAAIVDIVRREDLVAAAMAGGTPRQ